MTPAFAAWLMLAAHAAEPEGVTRVPQCTQTVASGDVVNDELQWPIDLPRAIAARIFDRASDLREFGAVISFCESTNDPAELARASRMDICRDTEITDGHHVEALTPIDADGKIADYFYTRVAGGFHPDCISGPFERDASFLVLGGEDAGKQLAVARGTSVVMLLAAPQAETAQWRATTQGCPVPTNDGYLAADDAWVTAAGYLSFPAYGIVSFAWGNFGGGGQAYAERCRIHFDFWQEGRVVKGFDITLSLGN